MGWSKPSDDLFLKYFPSVIHILFGVSKLSCHLVSVCHSERGNCYALHFPKGVFNSIAFFPPFQLVSVEVVLTSGYPESDIFVASIRKGIQRLSWLFGGFRHCFTQYAGKPILFFCPLFVCGSLVPSSFIGRGPFFPAFSSVIILLIFIIIISIVLSSGGCSPKMFGRVSIPTASYSTCRTSLWRAIGLFSLSFDLGVEGCDLFRQLHYAFFKVSAFLSALP